MNQEYYLTLTQTAGFQNMNDQDTARRELIVGSGTQALAREPRVLLLEQVICSK